MRDRARRSYQALVIVVIAASLLSFATKYTLSSRNLRENEPKSFLPNPLYPGRWYWLRLYLCKFCIHCGCHYTRRHSVAWKAWKFSSNLNCVDYPRINSQPSCRAATVECSTATRNSMHSYERTTGSFRKCDVDRFDAILSDDIWFTYLLWPAVGEHSWYRLFTILHLFTAAASFIHRSTSHVPHGIIKIPIPIPSAFLARIRYDLARFRHDNINSHSLKSFLENKPYCSKPSYTDSYENFIHREYIDLYVIQVLPISFERHVVYFWYTLDLTIFCNGDEVQLLQQVQKIVATFLVSATPFANH